jgi:RHS repeat-associated protein
MGIEVDGQSELQWVQRFGAVNGAVDINTTPSVQYTYSDPGTGSLLTSMVYPNGRTIDYSYGSGMSNANAALDQAIGRLDAIVDGANSGDAGQVLQQYSYLGLSTIVAENDPQTGINLTYLGSAGSIGAGGDQYVGLDQFGRVVDQNWVNSATGVSTNNLTYTYDDNSSVTAESNVLNSAYSQAFTYDDLNRLTASTLGGAAAQSWTLDSQGNWSSVTTNGTTQIRTANAQNQITSISGTSATPTYGSNGNMTTDQNGNTYVYNAWNQLVSVSNPSGQIIAQYTYNAMGYRVTESYPLGGTGVPAGTTNYIYYDSQWSRRAGISARVFWVEDGLQHLIETGTGGTANTNVTSQMVWSASYINAAVLQDSYSGGVIQPNSRLYFEQDANWDTTAVVGFNATAGTWNVVQRYTYSPYGTITVLNADWSAPPAGTQPVVNNLYQGMTLDSVTGLYYERYRNYSPSLGTWISQDPLQYINGANTYQFVMCNPVGRTDAGGLASKSFTFNVTGHSPPFTVTGDEGQQIGVNGASLPGTISFTLTANGTDQNRVLDANVGAFTGAESHSSWLGWLAAKLSSNVGYGLVNISDQSSFTHTAPPDNSQVVGGKVVDDSQFTATWTDTLTISLQLGIWGLAIGPSIPIYTHTQTLGSYTFDVEFSGCPNSKDVAISASLAK